MAFLSPLGLGAQIVGRKRRRRPRSSSKVVKLNNTPTSRFQLKPHGQKRKKDLGEVNITHTSSFQLKPHGHKDLEEANNTLTSRFQLKPHGQKMKKDLEEVNNTPTSRFQLKPHGQKRKKELEVETQEKKTRGKAGCTKVSVFNSNDNEEDNLTREILSWLPVKSLMRLKCVCKYWFSLIQEDMTFINLHLQRSRARPSVLISNFIKDKNKYRLMSGDLLCGNRGGGAISAANFHTLREVDFTDCDLMLTPVNGLIGFFSEGRINPGVCICNLSTREVTPWIESKLLRDVRKKDLYASRDCPMATCKLGYDPATKVHKVVGIWRSSEPSYEVCEVLTVGKNEWRQIDEVPPYSLELDGSSIYINGSIYYSTNLLMVSEAYNKDRSRYIVAFDVGREKFRTILVPNYIFEQPDDDTSFIFYDVVLLDLGGKLGLLIQIAEDGYTPKLWLFDGKRSKKKLANSWTEVNIELPRDRLGYSFDSLPGTSQIILTSYVETSDGLKSDTTCHSYNWKQKSLDEIEISGIPSVPYVSSVSRISTFFENLLPVQAFSCLLPDSFFDISLC